MGSKFTELVVDSAAPDRLAAFWMAVFGWQPTGRYVDGRRLWAEPASVWWMVGRLRLRMAS